LTVLPPRLTEALIVHDYGRFSSKFCDILLLFVNESGLLKVGHRSHGDMEVQHGDNDMQHFCRRRYPATWTCNIDKQHGHKTYTVTLKEVFFVVAMVSAKDTFFNIAKFNVLMKSKFCQFREILAKFGEILDLKFRKKVRKNS
jgi:hypothetical protein